MLAGRLLAGFAAAGYAPSIQIFVAEITEVGQQFIYVFVQLRNQSKSCIFPLKAPTWYKK